jgi:hypothetical protein
MEKGRMKNENKVDYDNNDNAVCSDAHGSRDGNKANYSQCEL